MTHGSNISRRLFLTFTAGAVAAPPLLLAETEVPTLLDHILLGVPSLESGIALVERRTGVRGVLGGVHPGRGTQNALLALGDRRYLEIIAPDPAQPDAKNPVAAEIRALEAPRLVGWAAHPGSLTSFAEKLRAAGISFQGPTPGSRKRPDGRLLQWQTLNLDDNFNGLLPFFIEWAPDSPHPSSDAPKGCSLAQFSAETPYPSKLLATLKLMNLDLSVQEGEKRRLRASVTGPKGALQLSS